MPSRSGERTRVSPCAALSAGHRTHAGMAPIGTNPERSRSPMRIVRARISEQTARRRCDGKRLGVAKKSVSPRITKCSAGSATGTGPRRSGGQIRLASDTSRRDEIEGTSSVIVQNHLAGSEQVLQIVR